MVGENVQNRDIMKEKGLMAMPAIVLFGFTLAIVAITLALILAKNVVYTKDYVANETRADITLHNFLIDNSCSDETKLTNAELISLGIMQKKSGTDEINIDYAGHIKKIKLRDCLITFFDNINYKKNYYFMATDKITKMEITSGSTTKDDPKTITYLPLLNDVQVQVTLVRQYE